MYFCFEICYQNNNCKFPDRDMEHGTNSDKQYIASIILCMTSLLRLVPYFNKLLLLGRFGMNGKANRTILPVISSVDFHVALISVIFLVFQDLNISCSECDWCPMHALPWYVTSSLNDIVNWHQSSWGFVYLEDDFSELFTVKWLNGPHHLYIAHESEKTFFEKTLHTIYI